MTALSLLDYRPPAQPTRTSRAAADAIAPVAGTLRALVLDWLRAHGPATDEEIQGALGMDPSTERPRRGELVKAGKVRASGLFGQTRTGRQAIRWEVVGQAQGESP